MYSGTHTHNLIVFCGKSGLKIAEIQKETDLVC